ncbi:unnamed protein product, partial [Discosporangium mesarthrocarpum]
CGETGADSTYCLDSCMGYEGELAGVDDYTYRYYLACGYDEAYFPHSPYCFKGCCPSGVR